jgi:hypothetical protein
MKKILTRLFSPLFLAALNTTASAQHAYETPAGHYEYGGSPTFGGPRSASGWTAYAAAEWVSRYMQRGYQQFGNAGAVGILLGGGYGPIGADIEQRLADTDSDREFRATLRASHHLNGLDFGIRATYMNTLRGNPSNWDLGFGVGGDLIWGIRWESEIYYGTEPKNFYADAGLAREWEFASAWSFKASAGLGMNLGYQRDAAKGFDHATFGIDLARAFGPQSTIYGGVGHYAPINRDVAKYDDHKDLYDGFVFRFGMRWDY